MKKILVLDDEPWSVSWIADFVAKYEVQIHFAATYSDACKYCERNRPDIAIVDIMIGEAPVEFKGAQLEQLPERWEGLKFVRFLRVDKRWGRRETEVVVYTALDKSELANIVERSFEGRFCTKADVSHFRRTLKELIVGAGVG